mmetsp:Transcript_40825/g.161719  ORF Transcript_40825/g.161719 Transcript_40825/m.161719 type:complete len:342 (-) Transcript_40825:501-1526(-)
MGREASYRRAESMYSPRVEGDDPDEEPPEEFTFDLEDDLAGLNDGNGFGPSRKSRIIRICVWTLIVSVVCLGVAAAIVFTVRSRGEGDATPDAEETPVPEMHEPPPVYSYKIVGKHNHSADSFTQGLFFHNGLMYESQGLRGESAMRMYKLDAGVDLHLRPLNNNLFGEGCALVNGEVVQLVWKHGKGFKYSASDLELTGTWRYEGEGWGITASSDGKVVYMTDGSDEIRRLDPVTLEKSMDNLVVYDYDNTSVDMLNELEYIDGEIWSNVWQQDVVLRIDPDTGRITGKIDFTGLLQDEDKLQGRVAGVLNGIAYDEETKTLYITGKNWPVTYVVEIVPP